VFAIEGDKRGCNVCVAVFVKFHFNLYKQIGQFADIRGNCVTVFVFGFWFDGLRLEGDIAIGQFVDKFLFDVSNCFSITTIYALSSPAEVFDLVIAFVSVEMVNNWVIFGIRYELLTDYPM
jgi:hypothetical protein